MTPGHPCCHYWYGRHSLLQCQVLGIVYLAIDGLGWVDGACSGSGSRSQGGGELDGSRGPLPFSFACREMSFVPHEQLPLHSHEVQERVLAGQVCHCD